MTIEMTLQHSLNVQQTLCAGFVKTQPVAHRAGAPAADDVLPHVAQLLDAHGLDQEVHRAVRDAAQHRAGLAVRRHHCARREGTPGMSKPKDNNLNISRQF